MDDTYSTVGSIYYETGSICSESTLQNEDFYTPPGSTTDLSISGLPNDETENAYTPITPAMNELQLTDDIQPYDIDSNFIPDEPTSSDNIATECEVAISTKVAIPARPPPIKMQKYASVQLDTIPKSPEKKDWKRSFAKRVSFTKTRILKSLSMNKHGNSDRNLLLSMRNSIRRLKTTNKRKSMTTHEHKDPETIKDTLGSDCEYFTFEKSPIQQNSEPVNDVFDGPLESAPVKPRRQFPQDKYLTGSEEMLQKAYNSLNRQSHIQDDKSIFDLSSTLVHIFEYYQEPSRSEDEIPEFITECLDAFLETNLNQIEHEFQLVNKKLGKHFDVCSQDLDQVDQSKKYKVEELLGSTGVCIITDTETRERFVALKRSTGQNWVSLTGYLQHIDKDSAEPSSNTLWVCYPADSITNMYLERDCFEPRFPQCPLVVDSLLQLLMLLRCQLMGHSPLAIEPASVLLVASHVSLVCIYDPSPPAPATDTDQSSLATLNDDAMRHRYQQTLMRLYGMVHRFLSVPANACRMISASYPLDYLFFVLLKLHRDINLLRDSISDDTP